MQLQAKARLLIADDYDGPEDPVDLKPTADYIKQVFDTHMAAFKPKVAIEGGEWISVEFKLPKLGKTSLMFGEAIGWKGTTNISGLDHIEQMIPLAIARSGEDLEKRTLCYVKDAAEGHQVLGEFYSGLDKVLTTLAKKRPQEMKDR